MSLVPRKRFGQNFLIDQNIIAKILETLSPKSSDTLVEIGPGLGALTQPLIAMGIHVHGIEIDRDIAAELKANFAEEDLTVHNIDVLRFDFSSLGERIRVFGNLPYNISTPLLFHLVGYIDNLRDMHIMLQKEVVERIVAGRSTPAYGRLSIMLQCHFRAEKLFDMRGGGVYPQPKVISSFVRLIPQTRIALSAVEFTLFSKLVTAAFGKRRKILGNALSAFLTQDDFSLLGIRHSARAENLSVEEYADMARYLSANQKVKRS